MLDTNPYTHIVTHMKTTVELPDDLLAEAKAMALRNRTTLKALLTRALERELRGGGLEASHDRFIVDDRGWPLLQTDEGADRIITNGFIDELRESEAL
jgi:hypothetical protein